MYISKTIFVQQSNQGTRLISVVLLALLLMFADHSWISFNEYKEKASLIIYPLYKIADLPFRLTDNLMNFFRTKDKLLSEIEKLDRAIILQQANLQKLLYLERENNDLRALLNVNLKNKENLLLAKILRVDPDPFTHRLIIDKGSSQGVYKNQVVVDQYGVVGKVIIVNKYSATVILITDTNHVIPVTNIRNGVRATVSGLGESDKLKVNYISATVDLKEGDLLVSSGLGGVFPKGYQVGVIEKITHKIGEPFAEISVKPKAKIKNSTFVLLIETKQEYVNDDK